MQTKSEGKTHFHKGQLMSHCRRLMLVGAAWALCFLSHAGSAAEMPAQSSHQTGVWTYEGTGTVNTYWVYTPRGGLVVIDTQRDLIHAAQAVAAVRAIGKPVRAILITHAHPDHYVGVGLFKEAFPQAKVYGSAATTAAIRNDTYGYNALTLQAVPDVTPHTFVPPDTPFDDNATLQIDGLTIITRELGPGEAHNTTAYYVPTSGELFTGDVVLNHLHAPLLEEGTAAWLSILDRIEAMYPNVRIVHPGHGASGPRQPMFDDQRTYLRACRDIAAEEIARSGFTDIAKTAAVERINARFHYINPTGIPDIVQSSVDGLFKEYSSSALMPVK